MAANKRRDLSYGTLRTASEKMSDGEFFVLWERLQRLGLRKIGQRHLARASEIACNGEVAASIFHLTFDLVNERFDYLAWTSIIFGRCIVSRKVLLEAHPILRLELQHLVEQTLKNIQPMLDVLGKDRAAIVRLELTLKLGAKELACLAIAETCQAEGCELPDFDEFSRRVAQSPMRSRAGWLTRSQLLRDEMVQLCRAVLDEHPTGRKAEFWRERLAGLEREQAVIDAGVAIEPGNVATPMQSTGAETCGSGATAERIEGHAALEAEAIADKPARESQTREEEALRADQANTPLDRKALVLDLLGRGERKKAVEELLLLLAGLRGETGKRKDTKAFVYETACQDKSEYYTWERGEHRDQSSPGRNIRRAIKEILDSIQ